MKENIGLDMGGHCILQGLFAGLAMLEAVLVLVFAQFVAHNH